MKLSAAERRTALIRRPWTHAERRVVLEGFRGWLFIAIEPVLGSLVFLALTAGLIVRAHYDREAATMSYCVGGIFALGFVAFAAYAVAVMLKPLRAYHETSQPIFIVDGYIRTRVADGRAGEDSNGYIAVLTADRRVAYEWVARGREPLADSLKPAHVEFSEYGGIHRIDGRSTGILPETTTTLGIGICAKR